MPPRHFSYAFRAEGSARLSPLRRAVAPAPASTGMSRPTNLPGLRRLNPFALRQRFLFCVSLHLKAFTLRLYTLHGGERGPVIFPAFKAGDSVLRGPNGGFDSHTLPPHLPKIDEVLGKRCLSARHRVGTSISTTLSGACNRADARAAVKLNRANTTSN